MKTKDLLILILVFCVVAVNAQILNIPADYPTIQDGIDAASDGDTVLIADGTYLENINFKGKAITVASHYILDSNFTHINYTILDGSNPDHPDTASVVRFVSGEDTTSILQGLTIQAGSGTITSFQGGSRMGGGVLCFQSTAKLLNNKIINNEIMHPSRTFGGGIGCYIDSNTSWLVVRDNIIIQNSSSGTDVLASGGGIYALSNSMIINNSIKFNKCESDNNSSGGGSMFGWTGSGIISKIHYKSNYVENNNVESLDQSFGGAAGFTSCKAYIVGNIIKNNKSSAESAYSAGLEFSQFSSGTEIKIENNEISNNETISDDSGGGSAINVSSFESKLEIIGNIIFSNKSSSSDFDGTITILDALYNEVIVEGNYIANNEALTGSGIYARNSFNIQINNNVFKENLAFFHGGGIFFYQPVEHPELSSYENAQPIIANNTFTYNHSTTLKGGAAISNNYSAENIVSFNNIYWQNTDAVGLYDIWNQGAYITISNSLIDVGLIDGAWLGAENIFVDPKFQDDTLHLELDSPCIDAGSESIEISGVTYFCPNIDFDGNERPIGNGIDIGADEKIPLPDTPEAYYPSEIGEDFFLAEWLESNYADGYFIDVAWDENFEYIDSDYDNLDVGNVTSLVVSDLEPGYIFYYRLRAYNTSGTTPNSNMITVLTVGETAMNDLERNIQVYPNPFREEFNLKITVDMTTNCQIQLFNSMGILQTRLLNETLQAGKHTMHWNLSGIAPGLYYIMFICKDKIETKAILKL